MDEQWYRVVMRGGDVRVYKLVDGNLEHNSMGFPLSAADRLCESVEPVVVLTEAELEAAALEQAPAPAPRRGLKERANWIIAGTATVSRGDNGSLIVAVPPPVGHIQSGEWSIVLELYRLAGLEQRPASTQGVPGGQEDE